MSRIPNPNDGGAAPCPHCGYDLRGHGDRTRCPECGRLVVISAAAGEINRWADIRLLDLWSISLLQTIGLICLGISLLAVAQGQYVALILGLTSGVYVVAAGVWFLLIGAGFLWRIRSPQFSMLGARRRKRLFRWILFDACLVFLIPGVILLLRGL